ncbi:tripartite tricarboxylate transporter substrate binding protein [Diaphorobacter ruginosibacter]|uniref:Tripartite tricarboxylate transporter substrate binding protein n=1 Tax=Diaphorobacter ruginosibacter TaxID=1715720 RepID=A0A7G9RJL1_9BURK|nr:tripartite tricarboxylate transporter substrate-binding protein [Diaphorobacter ruginosibacter]QNN55786.1 tripartite tricarboxylate transporter substrate binding protein [Diaphorobacter ruginosibacter]
MTLLQRRRFIACAVAAPLALHAGIGRAAGKPMTIIVPYPAGGSLDAMARVIAQGLGDLRGHSVVVDNKPGFSGNIGAQYVAKSTPDGSTLLMTALTSYAINASLMGKAMGYDLLKDLDHVAIVGDLPNVLIAPAGLPVNNVAEFVQYAKSRPGQLSYATTGSGSLEHIAGEMLCRAAGIEMVAVPYKGSTPGVTDLIGGLIQAQFVNTSTAINNLKSGRIKVLGIAGPATVKALPGVQTFAAQNVKMMNDVVSIFGIAAPAGTPKDFVEALNADINRVLGKPDVHTRFDSLGVDVVTKSGAYATDRIRKEIAIWDKVVKTTGISLN